MHIHDPNGSIRFYRREQERRLDLHAGLWVLGFALVVLAFMAYLWWPYL